MILGQNDRSRKIEKGPLNGNRKHRKHRLDFVVQTFHVFFVDDWPK